jgi:hypothetical protein
MRFLIDVQPAKLGCRLRDYRGFHWRNWLCSVPADLDRVPYDLD